MAKKVMVNVERVKPKTKIVMVKLEKVKQPKQPKDVSTHFKFKKVTEWANKQILARFKFKKVAKGENIKLKLVKKSKKRRKVSAKDQCARESGKANTTVAAKRIYNACMERKGY